jgi:transcriptional regulator with XRE-family HTH domain
MRKLGKLKAAIFERGLKQSEIARLAGINRTYLSQAIQGRLILRADEQKKIAKVLKADPAELFEESAVSV